MKYVVRVGCLILIISTVILGYQHIQNKKAVQWTISTDLYADYLFLHNYLVASEGSNWQETDLIEDRIIIISNKIGTVNRLLENSTYAMDDEKSLLHDLYYSLDHIAFNEDENEDLLELKELLEKVGMTHEQTEQIDYDDAIEQLQQLVQYLNKI